MAIEGQFIAWKDILCLLMDMMGVTVPHFTLSDLLARYYWAPHFINIFTNYANFKSFYDRESYITPIQEPYSDFFKFYKHWYSLLANGAPQEAEQEASLQDGRPHVLRRLKFVLKLSQNGALTPPVMAFFHLILGILLAWGCSAQFRCSVEGTNTTEAKYQAGDEVAVCVHFAPKNVKVPFMVKVDKFTALSPKNAFKHLSSVDSDIILQLQDAGFVTAPVVKLPAIHPPKFDSVVPGHLGHFCPEIWTARGGPGRKFERGVPRNPNECHCPGSHRRQFHGKPV